MEGTGLVGGWLHPVLDIGYLLGLASFYEHISEDYLGKGCGPITMSASGTFKVRIFVYIYSSRLVAREHH